MFQVSAGEKPTSRSSGAWVFAGLLPLALAALFFGGFAEAAVPPPEQPVAEACSGPFLPGVQQLCGTLNPGASAAVGYYFAYNVGSNCGGGHQTEAGTVDGQAVPVSVGLTGLSPNTRYAFCLVATNEGGSTFSQTMLFWVPPDESTLPPEAPVTEPCPGPVSGDGAQLNVCGTLNPGASAAVGYYFAYNVGSNCGGGWHTTTGTVDGQAVSVSAQVSGLEAGTLYSYCLVATNAGGDTAGQALLYATPPWGDPGPPERPPATEPEPPVQPPTQPPTPPPPGTGAGGTTASTGTVLAPTLAPTQSARSTPRRKAALKKKRRIAHRALRRCHHKHGHRRTRCLRRVHRKYGRYLRHSN